MATTRKFLGPRSKYDKSLPFTYEAKVDALRGNGSEPIYHYYFSDTLCGLVECLADSGVLPAEAQIFGVYRRQLTPLDITCCSDINGHWIERPELCRVLEALYEKTHDERYKGHVDDGHCAFEDRTREGIGPY